MTFTQEEVRADLQQIRVAVVLNGGVSLAVWISGVAMELNALVQGSRAPLEEMGGDVYAELLDLLLAEARVDVVAGTSAGGLNGGFLSLGLVRGCDLSAMRTMWQDSGDLLALLRDPREKGAPSLLSGAYFHERLADSYRRLLAADRPGRLPQPAPEEPLELYLTGTLWEGRRSVFSDHAGRRITEVDYDALFHFRYGSGPGERADACGNLSDDRVSEQLAHASRCTSSFPGAFEPWPVEVTGPAEDGRWCSSAGLTNFGEGQFVIDGGVLRNKPIRPALEAVYRQKAGPEVRRLMVYVVPDPAESAPVGESPHAPEGEPPRAASVVLGVLTRLRSTDSVSRELTEIGRNNRAVRNRRHTRDRLAAALVGAAAGGAPRAGTAWWTWPSPRISRRGTTSPPRRSPASWPRAWPRAAPPVIRAGSGAVPRSATRSNASPRRTVCPSFPARGRSKRRWPPAVRTGGGARRRWAGWATWWSTC